MKLLFRRSFYALLALGALSGCNSSNSDAPVSSSVKMLSMDYDAESSKLQQKVVDDFNAQSKEGKVELEIIKWDDGHQKLQTLISGGQAPDLAIVGVRWMAEYQNAALLDDFSSVAP
ncbi:extracellular solute-binding protein, partial [Escherichia coli]|uniref:ABC transporter substrate-binding protein n=1 Tax=Escherichia coli TaxID=562 RepID=UPI001303B615